MFNNDFDRGVYIVYALMLLCMGFIYMSINTLNAIYK